MKSPIGPIAYQRSRVWQMIAAVLVVTISVPAFSAKAEEIPSSSTVGTILTENGALSTDGCSDFLDADVFRSLPAPKIASCVNPETVNNRNEEGWTALHLTAAYSKNSSLVHYLVGLGADMTLLDRRKRRPIHVAAEVGNSSEIIIALALAGADINSRMNQRFRLIDSLPGVDGSYGTTPLHLAAARIGKDDLAAALLLAGADPNIKDEKNERTALHVAAKRSKNSGVIGLLLRNDADPNSRDDDGLTPLMLAIAKSPSSSIIPMMLSRKGNPDLARDDGITALMIMGRNADSEADFKILLAASDELCAEDDEGRSALFFAEQNEKLRETDTYWELHQECNVND